MEEEVEKFQESEVSVLDRALTLVSNRKSQVQEIHRLLAEAVSLSKELSSMRLSFAGEAKEAEKLHWEEVERLDAELEAAKKQHAEKVRESEEKLSKALNRSRSLIGGQESRLRAVMEEYLRAKRSVAKMVSELP